MGFGYILLHSSLYFGTYCIAFWCKIHCVLVHIALRFGAKCTAFWCKMHCVLVHIAMRFAAKCVATTSNQAPFSCRFGCKFWGFFLQREMQKHSKCPKTEGISTQKMLKFHRLGAFYMDFGGYFLLEWFGRKTRFVKYIYHFNKSLTHDFGGKANGYAAA